MKINSLEQAFAAGILHSVSGSSQLSTKLRKPQVTFILKGHFKFFNHPNCLLFQNDLVID